MRFAPPNLGVGEELLNFKSKNEVQLRVLVGISSRGGPSTIVGEAGRDGRTAPDAGPCNSVSKMDDRRVSIASQNSPARMAASSVLGENHSTAESPMSHRSPRTPRGADGFDSARHVGLASMPSTRSFNSRLVSKRQVSARMSYEWEVRSEITLCALSQTNASPLCAGHFQEQIRKGRAHAESQQGTGCPS